MTCGKLPGERFAAGLDLFCGGAGETRHFARMWRENHRPATTVDFLGMLRKDVERVGVEDEGELRDIGVRRDRRQLFGRDDRERPARLCDERAELTRRGIEVARDGLEIEL